MNDENLTAPRRSSDRLILPAARNPDLVELFLRKPGEGWVSRFVCGRGPASEHAFPVVEPGSVLFWPDRINPEEIGDLGAFWQMRAMGVAAETHLYEPAQVGGNLIVYSMIDANNGLRVDGWGEMEKPKNRDPGAVLKYYLTARPSMMGRMLGRYLPRTALFYDHDETAPLSSADVMKETERRSAERLRRLNELAA